MQGFRPFSLEELALIPTACVYNPRFVYFSANAVSSTQISIMNTGVGIRIPGINPPYIPKDSSLITGSSLLLIHAAMERPAVNKISVAIIGWILNLETKIPLNAPHNIAATQATKTQRSPVPEVLPGESLFRKVHEGLQIPQSQLLHPR